STVWARAVAPAAITKHRAMVALGMMRLTIADRPTGRSQAAPPGFTVVVRTLRVRFVIKNSESRIKNGGPTSEFSILHSSFRNLRLGPPCTPNRKVPNWSQWTGRHPPVSLVRGDQIQHAHFTPSAPRPPVGPWSVSRFEPPRPRPEGASPDPRQLPVRQGLR